MKLKKGMFSKICVLGSLLFIVAYTIVITYTFYRHSTEPTILTPLVYSFFGGELVMLFLKKRLDIKKSEYTDNEHDNTNNENK